MGGEELSGVIFQTVLRAAVVQEMKTTRVSLQ